MADLTQSNKAGQIDLNSPGLALPDEKVEYNLGGDAFQGLAPTPDGKHVATLSLSKKGLRLGETKKDKTQFGMANIEARIEAPGTDHDKFPVFDTVFTLVQRGSGTSTIIGMLQATQASVSAKASIKDLFHLTDQTLKGNPRVEIVTRWEASCGSDSCKAANNGNWYTFMRNQNRFPPNGNGGYKFTVECPKCKAEVNASAKIQRYSAITNGVVQGDQEVPF